MVDNSIGEDAATVSINKAYMLRKVPPALKNTQYSITLEGCGALTYTLAPLRFQTFTEINGRHTA